MRFKPEGVTPNRWASLAGVSRTVWSDMRRHGNPSRRTLEKLLSAAGSSLAEFEALRIGAEVRVAADSGTLGEHGAGGWRGAPLPPLRLLEARAAPTAEFPALIAIAAEPSAEMVARPPSLASDHRAYALPVVEDSLWPRFRIGRHLIVSPAAAVEVGDDVVIRLAGEGGRALVKEMVGSSAAGVEVRQFNPDRTFVIPSGKIAALEKIVGEAI